MAGFSFEAVDFWYQVLKNLLSVLEFQSNFRHIIQDRRKEIHYAEDRPILPLEIVINPALL